MRILFVIRSIDSSRGGVERNSNALYRYFESQGIECFCIYAEEPAYDSKVMPEDRRMRIDIKSDRRLLVKRCSEYISSNNIDVVLNRGVYYSFLMDVYEQLKKEGRCRVVHSLHSSPEDMCPWNMSFRIMVKRLYHILPFFHNRLNKRRRMYAVCDRFVLLSDSYVESAVREFRLSDRDKFVTIPNPRPYDTIDRDIIGTKKKQVLIVSRFDEEQKNLKAAVRIWKMIEKRGAEGWELVLAGHGEDEKMLLDYARRQGLCNFRFVGRSINPLPLYQESSVFMMTSHYEGFPTTLQESLQNGCAPVVFDTFSALHDIVTDGQDALIIKAGDEEAYAEGLYRLMRDEDMRRGMAMKAMTSCDKFRMDVVGRMWTALFDDLIKGKI